MNKNMDNYGDRVLTAGLTGDKEGLAQINKENKLLDVLVKNNKEREQKEYVNNMLDYITEVKTIIFSIETKNSKPKKKIIIEMYRKLLKLKDQGFNVDNLLERIKKIAEELGNQKSWFEVTKEKVMNILNLGVESDTETINDYRKNIDNLINLSGTTRLYSIKEEDREKTLIELLNKTDENRKNIISDKYKSKINSMLEDGGLTVLGALDLVIKTIYDKEEYFTN